VVTFLYAINGDLGEAQDAAQEAYARAWQRWRTLESYADPEAWVRSVGYRLALSRWSGHPRGPATDRGRLGG
jgi:RNA polymerase sigma-70 factor (ECF subfamily)